MRKIIFASFLTFILAVNISFSQMPDFNSGNFKKLELTEKVKSLEIKHQQTDVRINSGGKSKVISALLSFILPGAGHFYSGRMDVGKYFFTAEAGLWTAMLGTELYGSSVRKDARSYASVHSGLVNNNKDDDYFVNVGTYTNIYDYNNDMLLRGNYDKVYDVNSKYWNWDNSANMENFNDLRKKSERIFNSQRVIITGLVLNRIASAISSFILTNPEAEGNPLQMNSSFIMRGAQIDGVQVNFTKSF
ncbi:MAG TPA: hypothetical protein PK447_06500 [Ignavibacteria bacterium]|nr:hypothetical protein [Ignavibacteria bacterium]